MLRFLLPLRSNVASVPFSLGCLARRIQQLPLSHSLSLTTTLTPHDPQEGDPRLDLPPNLRIIGSAGAGYFISLNNNNHRKTRSFHS